MPKLTIQVDVTDEQAEAMADMQAMVLFVTVEEKNVMRAIVGQTHDFLRAVHKNLNTLHEVIETRGANEPDLAETIDMLRDPSRRVLEMFHVFRSVLGRAYFAVSGANGRTLQ